VFITTSVVATGNKLSLVSGVVITGDKLTAGVIESMKIRNKTHTPVSTNTSANFRKNFKWLQ
jgi:hypothetical protein